MHIVPQDDGSSAAATAINIAALLIMVLPISGVVFMHKQGGSAPAPTDGGNANDEMRTARLAKEGTRHYGTYGR
eukprot:COSAG06_NODE_4920_length_3858_cov_2.130620_1_plen_74_part_00